jgi:PTS system nitrogen regulatory IIA component
MSLIDFFREECIEIQSEAVDKDSLLAQIAEVAKRAPALDDIPHDVILSGLKQREELGSTGFQDGIAIPHCLLPEVGEFVVGLITHKTGLDFASLDGKATSIIAFIIGPREQRDMHIRLLSSISRVLSNMAVAGELRAATSRTAAMESFLRNLGDTLSQDTSSRRNLLIVSVQNESLFPDILQLFSEADDCYLSVIDAHDGSEYLHSLPLFAAFWDDRQKGFHRIIMASIRHSLANEMLRRLDALVEGLKECRGVLVQVQDVLYSSGNIEL